eukprot:2705629-Amphidinium_carterae.1
MGGTCQYRLGESYAAPGCPLGDAPKDTRGIGLAHIEEFSGHMEHQLRFAFRDLARSSWIDVADVSHDPTVLEVPLSAPAPVVSQPTEPTEKLSLIADQMQEVEVPVMTSVAILQCYEAYKSRMGAYPHADKELTAEQICCLAKLFNRSKVPYVHFSLWDLMATGCRRRPRCVGFAWGLMATSVRWKSWDLAVLRNGHPASAF